MQAVPVVHDHRCEGPIDWMVNAVDAVIATAAAKLGIELREPLRVIYVDAGSLTTFWRQLSRPGTSSYPSYSPTSFFRTPYLYLASERALVLSVEWACGADTRLLGEVVLIQLFQHLLHTQFSCGQIRMMAAIATELSCGLYAALSELHPVCDDLDCVLACLFAEWVLSDDDTRFPLFMTDPGSAAVREFLEGHDECALDPDDLPPTREELLEAADAIFACVSAGHGEGEAAAQQTPAA